jgi:general secretion pathway protein I
MFPSKVKRQPRSRQARAGFSLLEVMIALAVMSIVLVSVYRLHSQTLAMSTSSRFYTQAPHLAQGKLDELLSSDSLDFGNDSGNFGENYPLYTWRVTVDEVASESLGELSRDFKRIDLTVAYNDGEMMYNLRTYRMIREET